MRYAQSPSIDFNQMLVVSVFFHFLLFSVFIYLPQTKDVVKRIKPAFTVNFVDIPSGPDIEPAPPAKGTYVPPPPKPVVERPKPAPKPIPKPVAKLKPIPKPVPEKSAASKALVSKLDQLLNKKTTPKKDKTAMAISKSLDDFESMRMKKTAAEKKPTRKKIAKNDLTPEDIEFERLSKKSASHTSDKNSKKTSSLLKELDELEKMNELHASLSKAEIKKTDPKAAELVKQMESIKKESVQIKINRSQLTPQHTQKFKSGARDLKMAVVQRKTVAPTASGESGDLDTDAASKYAGEITLKFYDNWKDPAGGGNGRVEVSFTLFPNGKISNPKIVKSSGDSKLDNLAIRAVKNAVPLPPFPKEIKGPNLSLVLGFDYVPQN